MTCLAKETAEKELCAGHSGDLLGEFRHAPINPWV